MPRVHYETPETESGVDVTEPDETHTDSEPLLTCLWLGDGEQLSSGINRKVKIPLSRVIRIEH